MKTLQKVQNLSKFVFKKVESTYTFLSYPFALFINAQIAINKSLDPNISSSS